jgi:O-antigen ligase
MIGWLLQRSDSATSLAILLLSAGVMLALGLPGLNKRMIGVYVAGAIALALGAELTFGVRAAVIEALGRDPTLTDRTLLWADVLALQGSPMLGAGFESFWLGPRLDVIWAKWWWRPTQAHNGYIEAYLNLGIVGLILLAGTIAATFLRVTRGFPSDFDWSRLRLVYLISVCAYNYTEAVFTGVHFVWTIFFIIAIDYPRRTPLASRIGSTAPRDVAVGQPPRPASMPAPSAAPPTAARHAGESPR